MKTRIIQTRFWDDNFIYESDIYTQHLYIYLLTSQYINISGIFQLPDGKIKSEAKLTDKQFKNAKQKLVESKKVLFKDGWVYVKNAEKNNNYRSSPKNETAYEKELSLVPREILDFFFSLDTSIDSSIDTSMDSSMHTTHKSKIINNNNKLVTNNSYSNINNLIEDSKKLSEIADNYKLPLDYVMGILEDLRLYCGSHGKKYSDYSLALQAWLRRDIKEGKAPRKKISDYHLTLADAAYFKMRGGRADIGYESSDEYINFVKNYLKENGYDS